MTHPYEKDLSIEDHRVLAAIVMFKEFFYVDWIVEITGRKIYQVLAVLEIAVNHGWLSMTSTGLYCIKKFPQKYYDFFSQDEKMLLYKSIANLLIKFSIQEPISPKIMSHYLTNNTLNDLFKCNILIDAGTDFLQSYQTEEALQCFKKAADDLANYSDKESDVLFIKAVLNYSRIANARHHTTHVHTLLNEALFRSNKHGDFFHQSLLEMHRAKNEWLGGRYDEAMNSFEKGWRMAKKLDNPKLIRSASIFSTFFLYWQGKFKEAIFNYEKTLADVEKIPESRFPVFASITMAQCYAFTGNINQALGMLEVVHSHCIKKGDLNLVATTEGTHGSIMLLLHRVDDAIQNFYNALEISNKYNNNFLNILLELSLCYAFYLIGDKKEALAHLKNYIKKSQEVKFTVQLYPFLMEICWAMKEDKFPMVRELSLESELTSMTRGRNVFLKGMAHRYRAFQLRSSGHHADEVLSSLLLSHRDLKESGHHIEFTIAQLELARQYKWMGMNNEANTFVLSASSALSGISEEIIPHDLRALIKNQNSEEIFKNEILQLGQDIISIRDRSDIIQQILSSAVRITGAERAALFLVGKNQKGKSPTVLGSKNLPIDYINHANFSTSMKWIKNSIKSKEVQTIDLQTESNNLTKENIRSCICVPIILRKKLTGALYVDNRVLKFSIKESDLSLLKHFAILSALALDNADAYAEIKRLNQNLQEEKQYYEEKHLQSLHFEEIIGESSSIKSVMEKVAQVAPTDTHVLILGETGVGKELVASAIHRNSKRSDKPFIRVHCSALPESLIPSELFGHEKGSFTGADQKRIGRFELANGGTIFLDEIGELSLDIQLRLLRIIQTKTFERVGSSKTIHSDFRLILATNRDLNKEVLEGNFRSDLFYRINVFPVYVPPLRERKTDIPLLANYFLMEYSNKLGKPYLSISAKELDKLKEYDWPGNIRELENMIERGVILSQGKLFQVPEYTIDHNIYPIKNGEYLTLEENERNHILRVLHKTGWKVRGKGGAAELLNIHPSTLTFRINKLGIKKPKDMKIRRSNDLG